MSIEDKLREASRIYVTQQAGVDLGFDIDDFPDTPQVDNIRQSIGLRTSIDEIVEMFEEEYGAGEEGLYKLVLDM